MCKTAKILQITSLSKVPKLWRPNRLQEIAISLRWLWKRVWKHKSSLWNSSPSKEQLKYFAYLCDQPGLFITLLPITVSYTPQSQRIDGHMVLNGCKCT